MTGGSRNRLDASEAGTDMTGMLLGEMRHRIRNDMQWIASLALIEGRRSRDPTARAGFEAIARRVEALAPLYDHLVPGGNYMHVDFAAYLYELCSRIGATGTLERRGILLTAELTSVRLTYDAAVALGIVVNELVTNAVKYAFPPGCEGRIDLRLHADSRGIVLLISDDGCGLGVAAEGQGLRLARGLIRQLGGQIGHRNDSGTVWRIALNRPSDECSTGTARSWP